MAIRNESIDKTIDRTRRMHGRSSVSRREDGVQSLTRAAAGLDSDAMRELVQGSIAEHGVLMTWEQLIRPVWSRLRNRRDDTGLSLGSELIFGRAMTEALVRIRPRPTVYGPTVLLACANEKHRTLPLDVLAAALAESGANCCVLGARVPAQAVAAAIGGLRPGMVIIWSQTSETADPAELLRIIAAPTTSTLIAAGPGWDAVAVPRLVMRPGDVGTATVMALTLLAGRSAEPVAAHNDHLHQARRREGGPGGRVGTADDQR